MLCCVHGFVGSSNVSASEAICARIRLWMGILFKAQDKCEVVSASALTWLMPQAFSVSLGSCHLWPVGWQSWGVATFTFFLLVCVVLVSCLGQMSLWWWVVWLVCRHLRADCSRLWLDPASSPSFFFLINRRPSIMNECPLWLIRAISKIPFLQKTLRYTTVQTVVYTVIRADITEVLAWSAAYTNTDSHSWSAQYVMWAFFLCVLFFCRVGRSTMSPVVEETAAEAVNVSQRRVPG